MDEIPQGEERPPRGKVMRNGDLEPGPETKTVLEDDEGWSDNESTLHLQRLRRPAHERLQDHLSRFEELLDSPTDSVNSTRVLSGPGTNDQNQEQPNDVLQAPHPNKKQNRTSQFDGNDSDDASAQLNQDVLWKIIEEGFHEMLDPLFKFKEQEDQEVTDTLEERKRWRTQIDEVASERRKAKEKQVRFEDVENAALVDPLVATAMGSEKRGLIIRHSDQESTIVPGAFVPTDSESLTRREEEISKKPLEDLLSETGYCRVDDEQQNKHIPSTNGADASLSSKENTDPGTDGSSIPNGSKLDPTMPQNMPNSESPTTESILESASDPEVGSSEERPSRERLEHLVALDQRERQINQRGGPGRMSYEEVEELVKADNSRELRGLVISWLDWASF